MDPPDIAAGSRRRRFPAGRARGTEVKQAPIWKRFQRLFRHALGLELRILRRIQERDVG